MELLKHTVILVVSIPTLLILAGCGGRGASSSAPEPAVSDDAIAVATTTVELEAAPLYPEPAAVQPEGPLGVIPRVPNVLVVASHQSQVELADFLHTTPNTLQYVNPHLPDPIPPGTLVVIPPIYRSEGETLAAVAEKIGLTPEVLQEANLSVDADAVLEEGTLLAVPPLYIVPEDIPLSVAADALGTDNGTLLAANPDLPNHDEILAGTVLVVPPNRVEQE